MGLRVRNGSAVPRDNAGTSETEFKQTINTAAVAVPAQGKGRKKVPAKDARTLAAERSAALIKDFEKNGVDRDALIAAAYPAKQPAVGFKIRELKTVIIIETPPALPMAAAKQEAAPQAPSKPAQATTTSVTLTAPAPPPISRAQPKPVPIQPAQPKAR